METQKVEFLIEDNFAAIHLPKGLKYVRIFVDGKRIELNLSEDPIKAYTNEWTDPFSLIKRKKTAA